MKKILFNCTTNIVGGGVKNSAIFIKYALEYKKIDFICAISCEVENILKKWDIDASDMYIFKVSPARDKNARNKLKKLADTLEVDAIFTMAGPAYVDFSQKHIMGISNPYITHADWKAFSIGKNLKEVTKTFTLVMYQAYWARKADIFLFQTNTSRDGFVKRLYINKSRTRVISNSIGEDFVKAFEEEQFKYIDLSKKIVIFCPAAPFNHKVLDTIAHIANSLKEIVNGRYQFEFILTINKDTELYIKISKFIDKFGLSNEVKTIGSFNYADAYKLYKDSDIVFVPSILETFSASYLEALIAKKILIVANKNFAKDICEDAAIYTEPFDYYQTAKLIDKVISDTKLQEDLHRKSLNVLDKYGTQKDRFDKIVKLLKEIV